MKIKITGISGYIGQQISNKLTENGHQVSGINRKMLYGSSQELADEIKDADVIINLAGATILQRWTEKNKIRIYESRVKTTQKLGWAIKKLEPEQYPKKFISASAIGIYEPGQLHTEESTNFEKGFVGNIVLNWENAVMELPGSIKKIILRMAPVLGKESKTVTNLLLPFKLGFGATIGDGTQAFPYIHEKDVCNAYLWAVEVYDKSDTFNLVAPERITNKTFTKEFARRLHRPAFFSIPGFVLQLLYGKAADLLTKSPEVSAKKIIDAGFKFQFPTIIDTLTDVLS